jgi:hypothetical protein
MGEENREHIILCSALLNHAGLKFWIKGNVFHHSWPANDERFLVDIIYMQDKLLKN